MRPAGLRLFGDQNEIIAFEDESIHQSWEEYDATLEALMKVNATLHPQVRARKPCSVFFFRFIALSGRLRRSASK